MSDFKSWDGLFGDLDPMEPRPPPLGMPLLPPWIYLFGCETTIKKLQIIFFLYSNSIKLPLRSCRITRIAITKE